MWVSGLGVSVMGLDVGGQSWVDVTLGVDLMQEASLHLIAWELDDLFIGSIGVDLGVEDLGVESAAPTVSLRTKSWPLAGVSKLKSLKKKI